MGLRILNCREQGDVGETMAVLYDSVTGVPLPIEVFCNEEDADDFVTWWEGRGGERLTTLGVSVLQDLRDSWQGEHDRASKAKASSHGTIWDDPDSPQSAAKRAEIAGILKGDNVIDIRTRTAR